MNARKLLQVVTTFAIAVAALGVGWLPSLAAKELEKTITQEITAQAREDVGLGRSGVFLPASAYTGDLTLTRVGLKSSRIGSLRFTEPAVEVSLTIGSKSEVKQVTGIVYVYFKLLSWERRRWDAGTLSIYQLDPESGKWIACQNVKLVAGKNSPHGRLACVMTEFGTFAMASSE